MHELSLSGAVLNTAVKHAGGRRVSLITLRVGRLRLSGGHAHFVIPKPFVLSLLPHVIAHLAEIHSQQRMGFDVTGVGLNGCLKRLC